MDYAGMVERAEEARDGQLEPRERMAAWLLNLDERDVPLDSEFGFRLLQWRHEEHAGDCTNMPFTCSRCVADDYLKRADALLQRCTLKEQGE